MGLTYGPFLLSKLPVDAVDTTEKKLHVLDQFARMGFCMEFVELIDGKAVKFTDSVMESPDTKLYEWLSDEKTEEILKLQKLGGSRPYSQFIFLDGLKPTLFVPDDTAEGGKASIDLADGSKYEFHAAPAVNVINAIKKVIQNFENKTEESWAKELNSKQVYVDLYSQIIDDITQCMNAGVIYGFGY